MSPLFQILDTDTWFLIVGILLFFGGLFLIYSLIKITKLPLEISIRFLASSLVCFILASSMLFLISDDFSSDGQDYILTVATLLLVFFALFTILESKIASKETIEKSEESIEASRHLVEEIKNDRRCDLIRDRLAFYSQVLSGELKIFEPSIHSTMNYRWRIRGQYHVVSQDFIDAFEDIIERYDSLPLYEDKSRSPQYEQYLTSIRKLEEITKVENQLLRVELLKLTSSNHG